MLILAEVDQKYRALCLQKNTYDFDTVARGVLRIFERSPTIILDLKKRYRFIQVDEFQDTSRLQWEILSYLVGGGPDPEQPLDNDRLFIVGDPQQSIYGFRQADVAVFSEVIQKITKGNKTNQLHQVQTLHERHSMEIASLEVRAGDVKLSENFRTLAISPLGLFNHLFNYVFDPDTHSIDSSKSYEVKFQELIPGLDNESKGEVVYIDYQVNATDEESDGISMGQVRMIVEELIRFKGAPRSKLGEDNLPKVFSWKDSRWFNRKAFDQAHAFYEKYGPITIVLGRFMPFIRTFAPFVAGVAHMRYPIFAFYNIFGGILWVCSLTALGYWIGEHPWVKANFSLVALAMIIIPGLPALWIFSKEVFKKIQARRGLH
jgi:hypothetical protein